MSRSNPTSNAPHPAARWFEWNGEAGTVRYYDKDAKKNVDVGTEFTFLLLDELATVGGWHEPSQSAIYANEVRDTRQDAFVVKAFKGGTIAEGFYQSIRDKIAAAGGQFVANCYIAFKGDSGLAIGSLKFKGSALGAWMDFRKANRAQLYKKAIEIHGFTEGKKGRVVFRTPTMRLKDLSDETHNIAVALDQELQAFLADYLQRTKRDQVDITHTAHQSPATNGHDDDFRVPDIAPNDDDIPF